MAEEEAASHASADAPYCSNCEEELALLFCEECDAYFCRECGEVLHKSAKMKQHNMDRIPATQLSSGELLDSLPDMSMNDTVLPSSDQHSPGNNDIHEQHEDVAGTNTAPDPSCLLDWNLQDVGAWLGSLGPQFAGYAEAFQKNHIRGRILPLLDHAALTELGVTDDHQDIILDNITTLQLGHQKSVVNTMLAQYPRAAM